MYSTSDGSARAYAEVIDCKDMLPCSSETSGVKLVVNFNDVIPAMSTQPTSSTPTETKEKSKRKYKEYNCSYCGKHFKHKGNMQQHVRTHTEERPFTCTVCGVSYKKSSALLEHRRRHKGNAKTGGSGKVHECEICIRSFQSKNSLKIHLRTHSDERSFSCKQCSKSFRHKTSLQRHLLIHAGNKVYACDVCAKRFYDSSDMKKHLAIHTGYKKYKCPGCGKYFAQSSGLHSHLKLYTCHVTHDRPDNLNEEINNEKLQSEMNDNEMSESNISFESAENSENESIESLDEDEILNIAMSLDDTCVKDSNATNELNEHSREGCSLEKYSPEETDENSNDLETSVSSSMKEILKSVDYSKDSDSECSKKISTTTNWIKNLLDSSVIESKSSNNSENEILDMKKVLSENTSRRCTDEIIEDKANGDSKGSVARCKIENLSNEMNMKDANEVLCPRGVHKNYEVVANSIKAKESKSSKSGNENKEKEVKDAHELLESPYCYRSLSTNIYSCGTLNYVSTVAETSCQIENTAYDESKNVNLENQRINHEKEASVKKALAEYLDENKLVEQSDTLKSKVLQNSSNVHVKKKTRKCRHCHMLFDDVKSLRIHLSKHLKEMTFSCDDCSLTFLKWRDFSRHVCSGTKCTDPNNKKYQYLCSNCDKSYKTEKSLKLHTRTQMHCKDCNKIVCTPSDMKTHRLTHHVYKAPRKQTVCATDFWQKEFVSVREENHDELDVFQNEFDENGEDELKGATNDKTSHVLQIYGNKGFSERDKMTAVSVSSDSEVTEDDNAKQLPKSTCSKRAVNMSSSSDDSVSILNSKTQETCDQTSTYDEENSQVSVYDSDENSVVFLGIENADNDETGICNEKYVDDEPLLSPVSNDLPDEVLSLKQQSASRTSNDTSLLLISNKLFHKKNIKSKSQCKRTLDLKNRFKKKSRLSKFVDNLDKLEGHEHTIVYKNKKDVMKTGYSVKVIDRNVLTEHRSTTNESDEGINSSVQKYKTGIDLNMFHEKSGQNKDNCENEPENEKHDDPTVLFTCNEDRIDSVTTPGRHMPVWNYESACNGKNVLKVRQVSCSSDSESDCLEDDGECYEEDIILCKDLSAKNCNYDKCGSPKSSDDEYEEKIISRRVVINEKSDIVLNSKKHIGYEKKDSTSTYARATKYGLRSLARSEMMVEKKVPANTLDSDQSSDSATDEDSEGYEECTVEEVQAMVSGL